VASSGSEAPTTCPSRSCATAACPYGERQPCRRNARTSLSDARVGQSCRQWPLLLAAIPAESPRRSAAAPAQVPVEGAPHPHGTARGWRPARTGRGAGRSAEGRALQHLGARAGSRPPPGRARIAGPLVRQRSRSGRKTARVSDPRHPRWGSLT
jgi:hypothetical protein